MKIKTCTKCGYQGSMWQAKPLLCKNCIERKPIRASTSHDKVKVNTNTTEGKKVATRSDINPKHYVIPKHSDKQKKINSAYTILKSQFIKDKPFCGIEFQNCTRIATDIHHKGIGSNKRKYYNDTTTWIQTCRNCHDEAHDLSAEEQYKLGLRIRT